MASRAIFKGSPCKGYCAGHRAGFRYAKRGNTKFSPYSTSFNKGMMIAMGLLPSRIKR